MLRKQPTTHPVHWLLVPLVEDQLQWSWHFLPISCWHHAPVILFNSMRIFGFILFFLNCCCTLCGGCLQLVISTVPIQWNKRYLLLPRAKKTNIGQLYQLLQSSGIRDFYYCQGWNSLISNRNNDKFIYKILLHHWQN